MKQYKPTKKELIPADLRWSVWERDNFTCRSCGARRHLSIDHIYPESKGGLMHIDNLQTLCTPCNRVKNARVWELTWGQLATYEPQLQALLEEARGVIDDGTQPHFCANEVFFGYRDVKKGLKWRLRHLVGYSQDGDAVLGTSQAYDLVYHMIYESLPGCRNCMCG